MNLLKNSDLNSYIKCYPPYKERDRQDSAIHTFFKPRPPQSNGQSPQGKENGPRIPSTAKRQWKREVGVKNKRASAQGTFFLQVNLQETIRERTSANQLVN